MEFIIIVIRIILNPPYLCNTITTNRKTNNEYYIVFYFFQYNKGFNLFLRHIDCSYAKRNRNDFSIFKASFNQD